MNFRQLFSPLGVLALTWLGLFGLVQPAAAGTLLLERGPYLQMATQNSITIRWRTSEADTTRVQYGSTPGALNLVWTDYTLTTEHEARLDGLLPETTYYYSIGSDQGVLAGDDAEHRFTTSPTVGTAAQTRVWIQGDSGTGNVNADLVYASYLAYEATGRPTDLWLMLGDNAYPDGTDAEYQSAMFDRFPELLRRTPLWSTIGNHDTFSASGPGFGGPYPYYDIFTLPSQAEAGGFASGSEAYYSFEYGNIHFIVLDSMISDRSVGGSMWLWLEADLATTQQDWIVAFWHHPPYSKGSHDSDLEAELIEMRENFVPLLEDGGVDLVLSGHSHSYERSFLIDQHYGDSTEFGPAFAVDGGDGRVEGDGPYEKLMLSAVPHQGTVFTVAGSSGKTTAADLDHPAMFTSLELLGSVILDVEGRRLDATFLSHTGAILDYWTMTKGLAPPTAAFLADRTAGESPLQVEFSDDSAGFPSAWLWDFQDDGLDDAADRDGSFTYASPGRYSVRLTVENLAGNDTEVKTAWICAQQQGTSANDGLGWGPEPNRLHWLAGPTDLAYQIVRGNLNVLRVTGGGWTTAQEQCSAPTAGESSWLETETPLPGVAWFYLVRPTDCADRTGSFGSGNGGSLGNDRDDGLQGPASVCDCNAADDVDGDQVCDGFDDCVDVDGDGFGEPGDVCPADNCSAIPNPNQLDTDSDGLGDFCDVCALDPWNDLDGDGICGDLDNCPGTPNPAQADSDSDGMGDVCEACPESLANDGDGDGICGEVDNCPNVANGNQLDTDNDGEGDVCDACPLDSFNDLDGDGVCGNVDNCINLFNPGQEDADFDGDGDPCDTCVADPDNDIDYDGVCGDIDNCPTEPNSAQSDRDGDDLGDLCDPCTDVDGDGFGNPGYPNPSCTVDNCPSAFNPSQSNVDGDTDGDACDICPTDPLNDSDFDGVCQGVDNCPGVANPTQADSDGDNVGNACDPCPGDVGNDPDADGICAADDNCPQVPNANQLDSDLDGIGDSCDSCTDTDSDGFGDPEFFTNVCPDDNCPMNSNPTQHDSDGDTAGDACDLCPEDPLDDSDGDGWCADVDNCPTDFNPTQANVDGDDNGDLCDICPNDPKNDRDSDGICGDLDNCPTVANPGQEDTDYDGIGDACDPN